MYIINLLLILISAVFISILADKKLEDVLPPVVFGLLLCLYLIAIAGKAHHSFEASLILFAMIWAYFIIRKRRVIFSASEIRTKMLSPGLLLYYVVVVLMFLTYSNHFVTVWDDFHYNATFPKDMFYYGTMPFGNRSATLYRSYLPLMQLFFYWGFQGMGRFSEPMMFGYKMFLIYTCMLPLFKQINTKRHWIVNTSLGICTILMPYLLMFELLESLSMDTFMALLFGYAVWHVIFVKDKDMFTLVSMILSLTCLTMVKQLGILFTMIALFTWFVSYITSYLHAEKTGRKLISRESAAWAAALVVNAMFWLSWKIFCNVKGNSVYLSGKLKDSVRGGSIIFPSYSGTVVRTFVKSIFTYSLDLARFGMSLIIAVIVSLILFAAAYRKKTIGKKNLPGVTVLYLGLIMYLAVLLYTYLFVFEDWEALSLSSIDRYFGTYALALLYISAGTICSLEDNVRNRVLPAALAALFLLCTPWTNIYRNLIPGVYLDTHMGAYNDMRAVEDEMAGIEPQKLEVRTVMVVTDGGNSIYSRGMLYNFIPLIPAEYIIDDPTSDHSEELLARCADASAYYVYFSGKLLENTDKLDSIKAAFDDGFVPVAGNLYHYDEKTDSIGLLTGESVR